MANTYKVYMYIDPHYTTEQTLWFNINVHDSTPQLVA